MGCGTAHGEIVDGAEYGQSADVTAGKEYRLDHEAVGGEGDGPGDVQCCGVRIGLQAEPDEGFGKDGLDEFGHEPTATAVGLEDGVAVVVLDGAA